MDHAVSHGRGEEGVDRSVRRYRQTEEVAAGFIGVSTPPDTTRTSPRRSRAAPRSRSRRAREP